MAILLSLLLSLDMDGCHISDPHIPMRTLYACVYCVPGCPRYPHPLTRLCVWRLLPARLLTDPGVEFRFPLRATGGDALVSAGAAGGSGARARPWAQVCSRYVGTNSPVGNIARDIRSYSSKAQLCSCSAACSCLPVR